MVFVPAGSPFSFPAYRSLWFTNFACNAAVLIMSVAASWQLVENGASPQVVALVQTALSLPLMLMSPLAGAISDGFDRRKVLLGSQIVFAVTAAALAIASIAGGVGTVAILGAMFVAGCSLAFNGPALMSSVSDTVPKDRLPDAVMTNAIGLNLARSVGPAVGGVVLAAAAVWTNYALASGIALLLVVILARLRAAADGAYGTAPDVEHKEPLIFAIGQGFRFVSQTRSVRAGVIRAALLTFAFSAIQALMPLIAGDLLGGGPELYGFLFAAFGLGALAGAFTGQAIRRAMTSETLIRSCVVVLSVAGILCALSENTALTALSVALAGAAWVIALSVFNTTIQLASPRRIGGRALSIYQMAVFLGVAGGSWIGGLLAEFSDTSMALLVMSGVGLATLSGARRLALPDERTLMR